MKHSSISFAKILIAVFPITAAMIGLPRSAAQQAPAKSVSSKGEAGARETNAREPVSREAIVGRWLLDSQQVGDRKIATEQLTLRIAPTDPNPKAVQKYEFDYSVPVNDIQFVSLRFIAKLDGSEADVTGPNDKKLGTVKITKSAAKPGGKEAVYKILLQGTNRPASTGTLTISADRKTLTSESETTPPGQAAPVRTVQIFTRAAAAPANPAQKKQ
jgi:hypothetical protein